MGQYIYLFIYLLMNNSNRTEITKDAIMIMNERWRIEWIDISSFTIVISFVIWITKIQNDHDNGFSFGLE